MKPIESIRLALALAFCGAAASAQNDPSPLVSAAAQLNAVAPQAVPAQTIALGTYDGATGEMSWTIPLVYPANLPDSKKSENGGPVHPHPVAPINSFDVTYQIGLANPPAGLQVLLLQPDEHGVPKEIPGQVDAAAHVARIAFHPCTAAMQKLVFRSAAGDVTPTLFPHLQEQLGAFVVPWLLVTIVYEPPGAQSTATYLASSTAGTTVSWSFARTSGLVDVENPDEMRDTMLQLASAGVGGAGELGGAGEHGGGGIGPGALGAAIDVLQKVEKTTEVTTTTQTTQAEGEAHGTSFTVSAFFDTSEHRYPGQGDRFVILKNILYVYLVKDGRVHLAPMDFEGPPHGWTLAEMQQNLPPEFVQRFASLDPMLTGHPPKPGDEGAGTISKPSFLPFHKAAAPRFRHMARWACERSGGDGMTVKQSDLSSTTISETRSETELTQTSGLMASIDGDTNPLWGVTYSSERQQYQQDDVAGTIRLQCGPDEQPFDVDVWLDTVFHTLVCVPAEPVDMQSHVTGTVGDEQGIPRARERVALRLGGTTYMAMTDASGTFRFPFRNLPQGAGALLVGRQAWSISYQGQPISGLRLGLARDGRKIDLTHLPEPAKGSIPFLGKKGKG
jgi:hypothetical protein